MGGPEGAPEIEETQPRPHSLSVVGWDSMRSPTHGVGPLQIPDVCSVHVRKLRDHAKGHVMMQQELVLMEGVKKQG